MSDAIKKPITYIEDVTYRHIKRNKDGYETVTERNCIIWYPDVLHRFLNDLPENEEEHL